MDKELKYIIFADLYRYSGNASYKSSIRFRITKPGFKYMYVFRKCQFYKGKKRYFISFHYNKFILRRLMYKYGYEIPCKTKIGAGFYIGHFGGVTINPSTQIGENVNISKGVTIGQTNRGKSKGVPIIGDKVWIGANATVVGNIKIGSNVLISPNAYVNVDVPDNSIVLGNPAKIISKKNATESYINRVV